MRLVAGLGNPGPEYADSRHNVGFMAADEIVRRFAFPPWRNAYKAHVSEGRIAGEKTLALKPQTFMNLSGESVLAAAQFYKIPPQDVVVIHDDMDLALAQVKVKRGGGAGGHNGLKSIDSRIGPEYARVRIGVGRPAHDAVSHVLGRFSAQEREKYLGPVLSLVAAHLPLVFKGDFSLFMDKLKGVKDGL